MSCSGATKCWCSRIFVAFIACIIWGLIAGTTSETTATTPKSSFLYFAYGSNLLTERIHFQNPSAIFRGAAQLDGYRLEFRLPSKVRHSAVSKIVRL